MLTQPDGAVPKYAPVSGGVGTGSITSLLSDVLALATAANGAGDSLYTVIICTVYGLDALLYYILYVAGDHVHTTNHGLHFT